MTNRLEGLVAATLTPMHADGRVNPEPIGPMVDFLIANGISGLYVCGSTGEGMSLTTAERQVVATEFINAAGGRVPVIVQVGHNSVDEAAGLAEHAATAGANIVSATCPSYFKVTDSERSVDYVAAIARASPDLPFYYYHIPSLTGSTIDVLEFVNAARERVPTFAGLKYTDTKLYEYQACLAAADGTLDVLWGADEMLLGAVATGARGFVGSTYNIAAPLSRRIMEAFDQNDVQTARELQLRSVQLVLRMMKYPFLSATKAIMQRFGLELGPCRTPLLNLSAADAAALNCELDEMRFDEWACQPHTANG